MKESELNNKVEQTLMEFETMGNIQPSADWNQSLMKRVASSKPYSSSIFYSVNLAIVTILIIILINLGFILNTIINDSRQSLNRSNDLEVISKELLINLNSVNN
jgi:hypothetical protein